MSAPETMATEKRATFRTLHKTGCFVVANAWDAGSARLLAQQGFKALATTSAGYAWSVGRPDGDVGRDYVLANAASIARATQLPVTADLLNGFGDSPEEVASTIHAAIDAGLAGGSIEDTTGDPARPVYDVQAAVGRIRAAVATIKAHGQGFVLTARADGVFAGVYGVDEAIRRLVALEEAGADVLYAPGLSTIESVRAATSSVTRPVNVLAGPGGHSIAALATAGARRVSVGSGLYSVAAAALEHAARLLKEGDPAWASSRIPYPEMQKRMST